MGFDFGAFVGGFATGAEESITARNKEIRTGAVKEFDRLVAEAESKEKGLRTKRDVTKTQAQVLANARGLNGQGFTEDQILGIIQVPEYAKQLVKKLESTEDLSQVDLTKIFKVEKPGTKMAPEEYVTKATSIPKGDPQTQPTPAARGAFGLPSSAYRQAEEDFKRNTGKSVADVRSIATGSPDLGADFTPMQGTLDLSQFAKPETVANIMGRLRDAKAKGEDLDSPQNKMLANQLAANAVLENQFKGKDGEGEGGKPRTAAAINSVIDKSLRVGLGSYELKGMIRFDPKTNEPVVIAGDAKAIEEYNEVKRKVVENQFKELDLIKGGKIVKDRNARDAILPYASIDKDDNVIWRKPENTIPASDIPAGPKVGAPSSVTEKPIPIPKDAIVDGKVNATKLIPGQTYLNSQGQVKVWNGAGWQ